MIATNMLRVAVWYCLLALSCTAYSAALSESSCNARTIVGRINGPKPVFDQYTPPFSDPSYSKFCYFVARELTYMASGHNYNLEQVDGIVETIARIYPESPYSHIAAVELQLKRRDLELSYTNASVLYQEVAQAIRTTPTLSDAWITLGRVQLLMKCVPCAKASANKARQLGAGDSSLALLLASTDLAEGDYDSAEAVLADTLNASNTGLTPGLKFEANLRLAQISAISKNYDAVAKRLKDAISVDDKNLLPYLARAEFQLYWQGDDIAAIQTAKDANRIQSTFKAKRIESFAKYLSWAKAYLKDRSSESINRLIQTSLVTPEEALIYGAKYHGLSRISEALIRAKVIKNINARDGRGNTALIAASMGKAYDIVRMLFNQHADINAQNNNGERVLSYLVLSGNYELVSTMLESGADVNYIDIDGNSPLSLAVFTQNKPMVGQLLAHGASTQPVVELAKKLGVKEVDKLIRSMLPVTI